MSRSGWVGSRSRIWSQSRSQNHWLTCLDECGIGLANCNRRCRETRKVSPEIELSEQQNNAERNLSNDFDERVGRIGLQLQFFRRSFCFQPFAARQNTRVALFFRPEKLEFRAVLILRIKISVGIAYAEGHFFTRWRRIGVVVGAAKTDARTFKVNLSFHATVPILARIESDGACETFVRQGAQRLFAKRGRAGKRRLPKTYALGKGI